MDSPIYFKLNLMGLYVLYSPYKDWNVLMKTTGATFYYYYQQ